MTSQSQTNSCSIGDDDKYTKFASSQKHMPGAFQKYHEVMTVFNVQSLPKTPVKNSSFWFACVYTALGLVYILVGGQPGRSPTEKLLNLVSICLEVYGLLVLRHKIQHLNSVSGISGMTMLMYAAVYTVRIWLNFPKTWHFDMIMQMELESSFGIVSLLLVLDSLWSIFVTHRSSYQSELDVLHVKYLIPGCFLFAVFLQAHFIAWTPLFAFMWSSTLYMDVLALMPQVVMMARGGGKVSAPIAHFVAATFLSRIEDLSDSLLFGGDALRPGEYFSYYLIIFFQAMHLLLVADFMYYYLKAQTSLEGLEKESANGIIEV